MFHYYLSTYNSYNYIVSFVYQYISHISKLILFIDKTPSHRLRQLGVEVGQAADGQGSGLLDGGHVVQQQRPGRWRLEAAGAQDFSGFGWPSLGF